MPGFHETFIQWIEKFLWEPGSPMTIPLPPPSSPLAAKAALAIAILLSWALLLQTAHAQQPGSGNNKKFTVALSETLAITDAASKELSMKKSITDKTTIKDATAKSVEKPTHRSIATKVTIKDSIRKNLVPAVHKLSRSISEQILVTEKARGPSVVAVKESVGIRDRALLSGAILPPTPPQLTILEAGQKTFRSDRDDSVAIEFHSSSAGTYKVDIENAAGGTVATLAGAMAAGENQIKWTGTDSQGKAAPSGTYTYYITARNDQGTRNAPSGGDGKIVVAGDEVAGSSVFPGRQDLEKIPFMESLPIVVLPIAAAAAGAAAFLISKRKKRLVLYLPPDAAPVIDDIKQKYPQATVEDYMGPGEQGSSRYMGVVISNSIESDDEWISGIIAKAKELAGVDSINLSYRGKIKSV
ncbi:flagellar hook capping protein [Candidatus Nitrososphaera evergladensis SR1]|uniref:Flagellar hook capping protein n=1 Tax=Candidatus Nitrososphaera evergladensis SR1 TaxID=1459636 RepID=A0A075MWF8_9ARCH|nr:FlgD immunoglobulin-like domain containing protein [Candidatus Nitrososphaera evergladensis]AIF83614.1 flagellar hook capping protein [Candidatus Nitrososphaera evergladensis SR1]